MERNLTLLPPESATLPATLADWIYPAIQKQYVKILTLEADVLADDDRAAVHQMRVSLRRLRSQIQGFGSSLELPKVISDKHISRIARGLGKVRDLDVLPDTFQNYFTSLPESEQIHLEKVAPTIAKRRRKEISNVKGMLEDREYQYFKLGLNNWLNHPQYTPIAKVEIGSILPELLTSVTSQLLLDAGWWIELDAADGVSPESAVSQLLTIHGDTMHHLRKQVKATRYLLELFPDRYPERYQDYLQDFKQIHQILGNIQDNLILDKFVRKVLGKRSPTKLPTFYDLITRSNYLNWQSWQPIQQQYQQPKIKQELQILLIQNMI
jgi:CHAD domain-containing protein